MSLPNDPHIHNALRRDNGAGDVFWMTLPPVAPRRRPQVVTSNVEEITELPLWSDYFRDQHVLKTDRGDFNYYLGGAWDEPKPGTPLLIFFHGAGQTALSFALLSKKVQAEYVTAAFDMRHHGLTHCPDEDDLSIGALLQDGVAVVKGIAAKIAIKVPIVLCGHSLGGAVATRVADHLEKDHALPIFAVVMLDIVEELALEALAQSEVFAHKLPPTFASQSKAVDWSLRTILKCHESAALSIPSQLKWDQEKKQWVWRVDLASTAPHWRGWFTGLTDVFLALKAAKLLILAGTPHDKLDSRMTIAHMQGKFQLEILPKTGHIIQVRGECLYWEINVHYRRISQMRLRLYCLHLHTDANNSSSS